MVNFTTELRGKVYYEFFNGEGSRIDYGTIGHFERGKHAIKIAPPEFPNGTYMLNIQIIIYDALNLRYNRFVSINVIMYNIRKISCMRVLTWFHFKLNYTISHFK